MATYAEIMGIVGGTSGDPLKLQIRVAIVVAANAILNEATGTTNHAARLIWAKTAVSSPEVEAEKMLWAVLAQNVSFTVSQITAASDATVQTAVNNAVNLLAQ
jgi:hypothetical protein